MRYRHRVLKRAEAPIKICSGTGAGCMEGMAVDNKQHVSLAPPSTYDTKCAPNLAYQQAGLILYAPVKLPGDTPRETHVFRCNYTGCRTKGPPELAILRRVLLRRHKHHVDLSAARQGRYRGECVLACTSKGDRRRRRSTQNVPLCAPNQHACAQCVAKSCCPHESRHGRLCSMATWR